MCSSLARAVRVRALAGDTVLCSWVRHFTLTVPLSNQEYKWVPVICWGNLTNCCWGVTCDGLASHPGGVEILLAASCHGNQDKLRPDEPVGSIRLHFFLVYQLSILEYNKEITIRLKVKYITVNCLIPESEVKMFQIFYVV